MNTTPLQVLKQYWYYDTFRPLQEDIIQSIIAKKDTLALLPTGGGKSICYQVPAMTLEGVCIVISPLIALIQDQVHQLQKRNIPVEAIYSGINKHNIDRILDNCAYGKTKLLYVSPERLQTDIFKARLAKINVSFYAIDEAHCISQWGHNFRPDYLKIHEVRAIQPAPMLAVTASATIPVQEDIVKHLELELQDSFFEGSFTRSNLVYYVKEVGNKRQSLLNFVQKIPQLESGIIYVNTRKRTREIQQFLRDHKIDSLCYHGGLNKDDRTRQQNDWVKSNNKVIIATNAFGMGIDKSNVRFVYHYDLPNTIEHYYQEAGRAGRDGKKAYCYLGWQPLDITKAKEQIEFKYPDAKTIKRTYAALCNYYSLAVGSGQYNEFEFDLAEFCDRFKLKQIATHYALKELNHNELIQVNDIYESSSTFIFTASRVQVYNGSLQDTPLGKLTTYLLRRHEGIHTTSVRISETEIANKLRLPVPKVEQLLKYLQSTGKGKYSQKKKNASVFFLHDRVDQNDLLLDLKNQRNRKANDEQKLAVMVGYIQNTTTCRSILINQNFSTKKEEPCQKCDNCKNNTVKKQTTKQIFNTIISLLSKQSLSIEEITKSIQTIDNQYDINKKIVESLKLGLDEGLIIEEKNRFKLKA